MNIDIVQGKRMYVSHSSRKCDKVPSMRDVVVTIMDSQNNDQCMKYQGKGLTKLDNQEGRTTLELEEDKLVDLETVGDSSIDGNSLNVDVLECRRAFLDDDTMFECEAKPLENGATDDSDAIVGIKRVVQEIPIGENDDDDIAPQHKKCKIYHHHPQDRGQQQQQQSQSQPPQSQEIYQSLHAACCEGAEDVIEKLLWKDPNAASRSEVTCTTKKVYDPKKRQVVVKKCKASYTFPINLAIQNQVGVSTVELLINAAQKVLTTPDGQEEETPLHVLLKYKPKDVASTGMMLLHSPEISNMKDRHYNTPLHVACMYGASEDIIRHLYTSNPKAMNERNFHGLLPIEIAQRYNTAACSSSISDKSCIYLLEKTLHAAFVK